MFKTMTTAIVLLAAVAAAHAEPPRDCTGCVVAGFPASSKEVDLAVSLEMAIKTNNLVACPDGPTCMPDSAFAPFIARGDQLIHEAWSTLDQREKNCLEQAKGSDVAVLDACIPPAVPGHLDKLCQAQPCRGAAHHRLIALVYWQALHSKSPFWD